MEVRDETARDLADRAIKMVQDHARECAGSYRELRDKIDTSQRETRRILWILGSVLFSLQGSVIAILLSQAL